MPSLRVQADPTTLGAVHSLLADVANGANKAISSAVNRTAISTRSAIATKISEIINLRKGDSSGNDQNTVSGFLKLRRASAGDANGAGSSLTAELTITKRPMSLMLFSPVPSAPGPTRALGVSVKTRRGKAKELLRHTFIARDRSTGGKGVYEREGRGDKREKRYPMHKRWGPTPLGVFVGMPGVEEEILSDAGENLQKNLESQLDRFLGRSKSER